MNVIDNYQNLNIGDIAYDGKILVTGGRGFIASHLINMLSAKYPDIQIINIDNLSCVSLLELHTNNHYQFIEADIRHANLMREIILDNQIKFVFHLAAETHVDHSVINPRIFFETNVLGTNNLLEAARELWLKDGVLRAGYQDARFLHVSTDEVYGSLFDDVNHFTESYNYSPSSPYSSSKAASDLMVMSYCKTYNFPAIISNCANNFGPGQHKDKFIPKIMESIINEQPIPIYGTGQNIREWLYVKDHCQALDFLMQKGVIAEKYNIGGGLEMTNLEITYLICQIMAELDSHYGQSHQLVSFVKDRPAHDYRYALNSDKLKQLGFKLPSQTNIVEYLVTTINWYLHR
jgi:dTDP-glucose 4,6-dehydratase